MAVLALDLGGTKLASAIISPTGRILCRNVALLEGRQGKAVGRLIAQEVVSLLTYARTNQTRILGLGISVPGISYARTGKVWAPNIPGWKNYPLKQEIERAILSLSKGRAGSPLPAVKAANPALPTAIASDRACCIVGETWRGSAKDCANAIFLAVGTGIGAGIMMDGKVLQGAHDIAGAVGWMALDRPFCPEYKNCGCFEYHASGAGLINALTPQRFSTDASPLFTAFDAGEPVAKKILANAIQFWGMAVANLVSLFNPEKIIFGGGVFGPAKKFIPAIYSEAKKWAQPIAIRQVKLYPSRLGSDAALVGAASLVLKGKDLTM